MIRITRITAAASLLTLLAGCANLPFFGSNEPDTPEYAKARSAIQNRPLEVPPDLSAPDSNAAFSIPGLTLSPTGQQLLASGAVLPTFDKVQVMRDGSQRWLLVNAPADAIWPQVRQFWLDQGFKLSTDNALAGLLETNWMEERPDLPIGTIRAALQRGLNTLYNSGMVDQYRMRLERSADGKSTEVFISHRRMEEVFVGADKSDTRWTPRPSDPEREAAKLKQLMVRMGVSADAAGQQLASSPVDPAKPAAAPASNRAELVTLTDGKQAIQLSEGFDRAWRRIGLALERAGYNITDRDRSLGIYYINSGKLKAAKEDGFLASLSFWDKDDKQEQREEYLAVVTGKDAQSSVRFAAKDGAALPDGRASQLLQPLLNELR